MLYNAAFSRLFRQTPDSFLEKLGFKKDIISNKQKISVTYLDVTDKSNLSSISHTEVGGPYGFSQLIYYCELLPKKLKKQGIIYKDTIPGLPYNREVVKKAFWKNNKKLLVKLLKQAKII
jgi:hypothetical protein